MVNQKLVVCIMGQNCENTIGMCLESVKDADNIIYCDGGSTDETTEYLIHQLHTEKPITILVNQYNQEDPKMNGKQRNFYLKYLKENYPDHWALCLDADEVVEDLSKIKELINKHPTEMVCSVKMRHLIQDLAHEDATVHDHWVLNRLFKISMAGEYPEVEHPVLQPKITRYASYNTDCTTIWHLAYVPNLWEMKKRYDNHLAKSNMHTPEYLKQWYHAHLFGLYPRTQFDPVQLPDVILNKFGVDKDELYFANRNLETKHFIDAIHWKEFFKCESATEFGCGKGPRVFAMNHVGINANGLELSKYAVSKKMHPKIIQVDVTHSFAINPVDLVIAYDLLEHITYEKLDHTIENLMLSTRKHLLISVPVIDDPNLLADPTHIIKETKDWWIKQFTDKNLKLIKTPDHFLFKEQLMIFEK